MSENVSPEEQARRRKIVASAAWAGRMEGLGTPAPEFVEIDELWITGKITREERIAQAHALLKARNG